MLHLFYISSIVSANLTIGYISPIPVSGISMSKLSRRNQSVYFSGRESSNFFVSGLQFIEYSSDSTISEFKSSSSANSPPDRSAYGLCYDSIEELIFLYGGIGEIGIYGDFWIYEIKYDSWYQPFQDYSLPPRFDFAFNCLSTRQDVYIHILGGMDKYSIKKDLILIHYDRTSNILYENTYNYQNFLKYSITGSQIQYYRNSLHVFSGYGFMQGQKKYFCDLMICDLKINNCIVYNLTNKLEPSSDGGSGIFGSTLYYFYGNNDFGIVKKLFKLNLMQLTIGWSQLNFTSSSIDCSRSSFGFTEVYLKNNLPTIDIFGGSSNESYSNSYGSIIFNSSQVTTICSSTKIIPEKRNKGSLVQISEVLLLFGGRNIDGFFDELWSVKYPGLEDWVLIEAFGEYPIHRVNHAAVSKGNFMVIFGGYDKNFNMLADYWLLQRISNQSSLQVVNQWKELKSIEDSIKPPPIVDTCAMIDFPFLFYIGGETTNGLTNEFWQFDLSILTFTSFELPKEIPSISGHGCYLSKENNQNFIFLFFGAVSLTGEPSNTIYKINITDLDEIALVSNKVITEINPRFDFAYTVVANMLFLAGGQAYFTQSFSDLWAVSLESYAVTLIDKNFSRNFHSTNFAGIAGTLYIFSGLEGDGEPTFKESSSKIIKYSQTNKNPKFCGQGFYFDNSTSDCRACSPGTYKNEIDISCIKCPSGTYNPIYAATDIIQCIPCGYGFYNNKTGQNTCEPCHKERYCFVGASYSIDDISKISNTQPDLIEPGSNKEFLIILGIVTGGIILLFIALWIFLVRFQVILSVFDLFSGDHATKPVDPNEEIEDEQDEPKHSYVGGFFTGLAFVILSAILTYYIYIFFYENIEETVILVPSNTLTDKDGFKDEKITIFLRFYSIRHNKDSCESIYPNYKISKNLEITEDKSYTSSNPEITSCRFKYELKKSDVFETGDSVLFSFEKTCKECYTSDIEVSVEGRAAYHNKKSKYSQSIVQKDGNVLKGPKSSFFYFGIIPAFYKDFTGDHQTSHYGYRITEIFNAETGSICAPSNIPLSSGLNIQVEFSLSQTGVYTTATLKFDTLGFFGIAVGVLSAVLGLIGTFMTVLESGYFRFRYRHLKRTSAFKVEYERKMRIIQKRKNLSFGSGLDIN